MRRKAFTLIELLVVIAIIGLLVSILVPSISKAQRLAKQAACASNLNGIGKTLAMYQNGNHDQFPFISNGTSSLKMVYDNPLMDCANVKTVFGLDGDEVNSIATLNMVENLNLLVKTGYIGNWRMFRCPQVSSQTMDRSGFTGTNGQYGFYSASKGGMFIDYAYHNGYSWTSDGSNGAPLSGRIVSNFVIMADQYGDPDPVSGRSAIDTGSGADFQGIPNKGVGYNHADEIIEMLTYGGSVQGKDTILGGVSDNNIYCEDMVYDTQSGLNKTNGDKQIKATPKVSDDSSLVKAVSQ